MAKSKYKARDRVAIALGLIEINQPLESQDSARILEAYDEVYEELKFNNAVFWSYTADIPNNAFSYVVDLMAYNVMLDYSVSTERIQIITSKYANAFKRIAEMGNKYKNMTLTSKVGY